MASFIDKDGQQHEVTLSPEMYKAAKDSNLTFRQYINNKFPTTAESAADTFKQFCASEGLAFGSDKAMGVRSTNLKSILDGSVNMEAAGTVREVSPVGSRVLFPAALLEYVESKLAVDRNSMPNAFERMLAVDTTVANARVEQPVISYERKGGPEDMRAQQITQLALPPNMLSITASERTYKIPTFSLGMTVSDEALAATTLDLVGLALTRQAEIERYNRADEALIAMRDGDLDDALNVAIPAGQVYTSTELGSIATNAGVLRHSTWVKWLYQNLSTRRIDWVVCNLATALAIESRTDKPTVQGDNPNSDRIDALFTVQHPSLVSGVSMFISESMADFTVLGLDSRYAIGRMTNSEASYSAVERFALRKGDGLRFDFGEMYFKPWGNEPFSMLDFSAAVV